MQIPWLPSTGYLPELTQQCEIATLNLDLSQPPREYRATDTEIQGEGAMAHLHIQALKEGKDQLGVTIRRPWSGEISPENLPEV